MIFIKLNPYQIRAGAGVCVCVCVFSNSQRRGDEVTLQS